MSIELERLLVRLEADTAEMRRALSQASDHARSATTQIQGHFNSLSAAGTRLGSTVQSIGATFAKTALTIAGTVGAVLTLQTAIEKTIKNAAESERVSLRLDTTLKAFGKTAGIVKSDVEDLAAALTEVSAFEDDELIKGMDTLILFGRVTKPILKDAASLMVDLAARMESDIPSAARIFARALVEPGEGLTLMRRAGVALTQSEIELIQTTRNLNGELAAQQRIITLLQEKVGGAGAADNSGLSGAMKRAARGIDEMFEAIGKIPAVKAALEGFFDVIEKRAKNFQNIAEHLALGEEGDRLKAMRILERELEVSEDIVKSVREDIEAERKLYEQRVAGEESYLAALKRRFQTQFGVQVTPAPKNTPAPFTPSPDDLKRLGIAERDATSKRAELLRLQQTLVPGGLGSAMEVGMGYETSGDTESAGQARRMTEDFAQLMKILGATGAEYQVVSERAKNYGEALAILNRLEADGAPIQESRAQLLELINAKYGESSTAVGRMIQALEDENRVLRLDEHLRERAKVQIAALNTLEGESAAVKTALLPKLMAEYDLKLKLLSVDEQRKVALKLIADQVDSDIQADQARGQGQGATYKLVQQTEQHVAALRDQTEAAKENRLVWNGVTQQYEIVSTALQRVQKEQELLNADMGLSVQEARRLATEYVAAVEGLKEVTDIQEAARRRWEEQAEMMQEPFKNALRGIQSTFADVMTNIFDGSVDTFSELASSVKRIFTRLAGELATLMIIRPFLSTTLSAVGASPSFMSSLGLGGGGGGGGGFGFGDALSGASSVNNLTGGGLSGAWNGLSSGVAGMFGQFGASAGVFAGELPGVIAAAGGGAMSGAAGIMATLGAAMPYIGAAALIGSLVLPKLFGGKPSVGPTGHTNLTTTSGLFGIGTSGADNGFDASGTRQMVGEGANALNVLMQKYDLAIQKSYSNYANLGGTFGIAGGAASGPKSVEELVFQVLRGNQYVAGGILEGKGSVGTALRNSKGTTAAAIEEDLAAAQAFDRFIETMRKSLDPLSELGTRLETLADSFDSVKDSVDGLGLATGELDELHRQLKDKIKGDVAEDIEDAILMMTDAAAFARKKEKERYNQQVEDAELLGMDLARVNELHRLNMLSIREQYDGAESRQLANALEERLSSLTDVRSGLASTLSDLMTGGQSSLAPSEKEEFAKNRYESAFFRLAADPSDAQAAQDLQDAGRSYIDVAHQNYASTAATKAIFRRVSADLGGFSGVTSSGRDDPAGALADALSNGTAAQVGAINAVNLSVGALNAQIAQLRQQIVMIMTQQGINSGLQGTV